jgi:hypothetical protein
MSTVCSLCKEKSPGPPEDISFLFKGHKVSVFKEGTKCRSCVIEKWKEDFESYGRKLVLPAGKLKVNWKFYTGVDSPGKINSLTETLISLGILCQKAENNWRIIVNGVVVNPQFFTIPLYFSSREIAMDYMRAKYPGNPLGWKIDYKEKIIKKETAVNKRNGFCKKGR